MWIWHKANHNRMHKIIISRPKMATPTSGKNPQYIRSWCQLVFFQAKHSNHYRNRDSGKDNPSRAVFSTRDPKLGIYKNLVPLKVIWLVWVQCLFCRPCRHKHYRHDNMIPGLIIANLEQKNSLVVWFCFQNYGMILTRGLCKYNTQHLILCRCYTILRKAWIQSPFGPISWLPVF